MKLAREGGGLVPKPVGGSQSIVEREGIEGTPRSLVREDSEAPWSVYVARLKQRTGVVMSTPSMCRALQKLGLPRKKAKQPKGHDEASRLAWRIGVSSHNSHQLIFGDESAWHLSMRSAFARSPKGQPAYSSEVYRPEGKVNLLACMSLEGVIAPRLVEGGSVNTQVFSYYRTAYSYASTQTWTNLGLRQLSCS